MYWDKGLGGSVSYYLLEDLVTPYTVIGLSPLISYQFKVQARNIYGYGPFSSLSSIKTTSVPYTMAAPVTTGTGIDIELTWTEPSTGGESITAYQIKIYVPSTLTYVEDLTYCDGSSAAKVATKTCVFPMTYLVSTYGMTYGQTLQGIVRAFNVYGPGEYSATNVVGAPIFTKPTFMNAPYEGASTTETDLEMVWDALTLPTLTGGSPITSYLVEWDQGTGTWTSLTTTASLSYLQTGLTTAQAYAFRVAGINIFGTGPYSTTSTLSPTSFPAQMAPVTTSLVNTNIKIAWTAPANNGNAITGYKVKFLQ